MAEVAVVGYALRSSLGGTQDTFKAIKRGESGIGMLPVEEEFQENATRIGGTINDAQLQEQLVHWLGEETTNSLLKGSTRPTLFTYAAMAEALNQARVLGPDGTLPPELRSRAGIFMGTGMPNPRRVGDVGFRMKELARAEEGEKSGLSRELRRAHGLHKASAAQALGDAIFGSPAQYFKFRDRTGLRTKACASGAAAIMDAGRQIWDSYTNNLMWNDEDETLLMVAGGVEELTGWVVRVFNELGLKGAMSKQNDLLGKASCPFSENASGFVPAEGVAVIVLANMEYARTMGIPVLAVLKGWGETTDAEDMTNPDTESQAAAIRKALRKAKLNGSDIDLVIAHATSTPQARGQAMSADGSELVAIGRTLGFRDNLSIFAPKASVGHSLGAIGAQNIVWAIQSMEQQIVLPTINLENPIPQIFFCGESEHSHTHSPECSFHIPTVATKRRLRNVLCNAFGFWGQNVCLVVGQP